MGVSELVRVSGREGVEGREWEGGSGLEGVGWSE